MTKTISLILPESVEVQVDAIARADGVSKGDVVRRAVEAHLFARRYHALRLEAMRQLAERGVRLTDEDVFGIVS